MNVPLHIVLWVLTAIFGLATIVTSRARKNNWQNGVDRKVRACVPFRSTEVRVTNLRLLERYETYLVITFLCGLSALMLTPG